LASYSTNEEIVLGDHLRPSCIFDFSKHQVVKVLYVIDSFLTGGAETSLLEISSRLQKFEPTVCILFNKLDLKSEFLQRNIAIIEMDIKSRLWWIEGVAKLKKIVADVKPDIVHATLFKAEVVTRLALLGTNIPHVGSFVNDSYASNRYRHQSFIRNAKLNFIRLIDSITARSVRQFMSITKTIAETNAKALHINPGRITCIYRGRNVNDFTIIHPSITNKPFIFLTVARLLRRKGYLDLFEAVKLLQDKGVPFLLRIAGNGNDYNLFRERVRDLKIENKVEFLLNRKDVPVLLTEAHCFVFPSHYEGQGGSLIEAMLAAKPIIVSDIPVFREQITHDETGKLFQLFNARDLAEKMEWMLNNYSSGITLGLKAREVAVERFNIENTVRLHEELYIGILAR